MVEINLTELNEAERAKFEGQKTRRGRPKKDEPKEPLVDWKAFSKTFCLPFNLLLQSLHAEGMNPTQEQEFTIAWGRVIDKWLPDLTEWKEEFAAVYVTAAVFGPPVAIYLQRKPEKDVAPKPKSTNGKPGT